MGEFVPPKPPEGVEDNSSNLTTNLETENSSKNDNNKETTKKKKGFLKRLLGKSKKRENTNTNMINIDHNSETSEEIFKNDESLKTLEDESKNVLNELDKLYIDDHQLKNDEIDKDLFSENADLEVHIKEDGTILENETSLEKETEQTLKEEDLDNIREALGVNLENKKSIREEFENNPQEFENSDNREDDWLKSSFSEELEETNNPSDNISKNDSFDEKDNLNKFDETDIESNNLSFEDEINLEDIEEKLDVKEKKLKQEIDKEIKNSKKKYLPTFKFDNEEKVPVKKKEIKKETKNSKKEDLPAFNFDNETTNIEEKSKFDKEYSEKTNKVFNKLNNLTEKKIEDIIKNTTTKKKNSLLNKDRENTLLITFERDIKKIISNSVESLKKEEEKMLERIRKKVESLDKKDISLNKKSDNLIKEEEKINLKIQELEKEYEKTELEIEKNNKSLEIIDEKLNKKQQQINDLEKQKNEFKDNKNKIKDEIKELNKKQKERKKEINSEIKTLNTKLESINQQINEAVRKLEETKDKVSNELKKITNKEKDLAEKEENIKKIMEEEKKVFSLLNNSNNDSELNNDVYETEISHNESSKPYLMNYESFITKINECRELIKNEEINKAKKTYNNLRNHFMSATFSEKEKKDLKNKLKDLYETISKY